MDIVDRLFLRADAMFGEQRDFAYALNVPPSMISAWRTRKSSSYNKRLPQIAELLGTTPTYLLSGETGTLDQTQEGKAEREELMGLIAAAREKKSAVVIGFGGDNAVFEMDEEEYRTIKAFLEVKRAERRKKTNI